MHHFLRFFLIPSPADLTLLVRVRPTLGAFCGFPTKGRFGSVSQVTAFATFGNCTPALINLAIILILLCPSLGS
jgi:hypothetical protein